MPHPTQRHQTTLASTAKRKSRIISGWRQAPKPPGVSKPKAPPRPEVPAAPAVPVADTEPT